MWNYHNEYLILGAFVEYKHVWILMFENRESLPLGIIRKRKILKILKRKIKALENSISFCSGVLGEMTGRWGKYRWALELHVSSVEWEGETWNIGSWPWSLWLVEGMEDRAMTIKIETLGLGLPDKIPDSQVNLNFK